MYLGKSSSFVLKFLTWNIEKWKIYQVLLLLGISYWYFLILCGCKFEIPQIYLWEKWNKIYMSTCIPLILVLSLCKFINIYSILWTICLYVVDLFYIRINCLKRNEQMCIKKNPIFLLDFMDPNFFVQKYIHFRLWDE